jgi:hypothetical protein
MLEAAHQSSCAVNASFLQVIVIERDKRPKETLESLTPPASKLSNAFAASWRRTRT